ncbi:MAG: hypothetical protein WDN25_13285 [Acetobacteraceae bacterium]
MAKKANGTGGGRRGRTATEETAGAEKAGDNKVATPALIAEAVAQYGEDRALVARATARCGANLSRFEAQGVDPEFIKSTWREMNRTAAEISDRHAKRTEYLVAAGAIQMADANWAAKAKQSGMEFGAAAGDVADRVASTRAKQQGYKAGRKGHSLESNPYKARPGSPEFVGWRDGLQDGLDDRKALKPGAEHTTHASTDRKRREPRAPAAEEKGAAADPTGADEAKAPPADGEATAGTVH